MIRNKEEIKKHYNIALLWAEDLDNDFDIEDIEEHEVEKDIDILIKEAGPLLNAWSDEQLGHDLYLTRQGHGSGFWDRNFEGVEYETGEKISQVLYKHIPDLMIEADREDGIVYVTRTKLES